MRFVEYISYMQQFPMVLDADNIKYKRFDTWGQWGRRAVQKVHFLLFLKIFLVCLKEWQKEGETRGKEILHPLIHSPNSCNGRGGARLQPGAWSSIWSSVGVVGPQVVGAFSTAFPGCISRELDCTWSSKDSNIRCWDQRLWLNLLCHNTDPREKEEHSRSPRTAKCFKSVGN